MTLLATLAPRAWAGLRPWEPSDYVQTGLVLHYDGIRNAGLDAAHDSAATTWKDLSPSAKDATFNTAEDGSAWTADGYSFGGGSYATVSGKVTLGTVATVQAVTKTTIATLRESMGFNGNQWSMFIGGQSSENDACNIYYNKGNTKFVFKNANGGNADLLQANWDGRYLTAIRNGNDKYLFSGAALPSSPAASGSQSAMGDVQFWLGSADGGSGSFAARYLKGPLNAIRLYSRVLENKELAWNRAVDEARFFGVAIPESALLASAVPDAVVATAVAGAEGAETSGCYVVDEDGYTFRAAPFASAGGSSYVCTGYTLAVWDEDAVAYGAAVQHSGEYSVLVKQGDKVKITWQWKNESGSLSSVGGYVKDNLIVHFDGICNAGDGRPHDPKATSWANLADRSMDVSLWHKTSSSCGEGFGDGEFVGSWTDDGFVFRGTNFFYKGSAWTMPANATAQLVVDIDSSQQKSNIPFIFCETDSSKRSGAIAVNKGANRLDFYCDKQLGCAYDTRPRLTTPPFKYVTAVLSGNKAAVFTNAKLPDDSNTAANNGGWFVQSDESKVIGAVQNDRLTIGGGVNWSGTYIVGTVKAIRLYSGVLSDAQLEQNRAVDEARFFGNGVPATGCVVVQSAIDGLEGREPNGLYFPDGWTFTAGSATQTVRGIEWQCVGYQLQTWDAASSTWGTQTSSGVSSYKSPSGTSFDSVRLTWLWKPVAGIRTAADYALADYATGGMQLHLDGLLNAGTVHDSSATVWSDLSGNGRDATLAGNPSGESHWVDNGYFFASNAVFATADTATGKFTLGKSSTIQILADATAEDNDAGKHNGTFVTPATQGVAWGSVWYKSDGYKSVFYDTDKLNGSEWNTRPCEGTTGGIKYLTALRDDTRTALISGTAYPNPSEVRTNDGGSPGWFVGSKSVVAVPDSWRVGASSGGGGANPLYGTVKSVRLYDRMLSEDELAWNRSVDSARFFGGLATTNVVEVISGVEKAYKVEGEWTFNAPATVTIDNTEKKVAGYRLEVWDSGVWKRKPFQRELSFRYSEDDEEVGGKTVKLIWSPEPEGLMIIVR